MRQWHRVMCCVTAVKPAPQAVVCSLQCQHTVVTFLIVACCVLQGLVSLSLYDTKVHKAAADRLQSSLPCLNIVGMSFVSEPPHA